ncbi:hypothetical protein [Mucilaginibacter ginsenosidivorax]|uniref:Uncharacterized protein n=1 Tax=Mucilaginibacter ginsenosidivorax TaxID=862126 RepID=A0A5B8VSM2_9SPHI|nr:hypothetical protein [Mucilaginibacter ginsenosidivorax]QEC74597.1 hypothetical protein FSB76_01015 [Mucilaginibacter ginsenosidivorax]
MIDEQNLKGTVVMLHPEMWEAHADTEGVIGEIVKADPARDDFYVKYGDGAEPRLHSSDALMVLKEPDEIYEYLQNHSADISPFDFKDLKTIALLTDRGTLKQMRTAMELVEKNESIRDASVMSLDKIIRLQQNKGLDR